MIQSPVLSDGLSEGKTGWLSTACPALVLVLGVLKLVALPLTETELFFGLMLVFAVMLLGWNLGMLVCIESNTRKRGVE
jgi:hypothetical protein